MHKIEKTFRNKILTKKSHRGALRLLKSDKNIQFPRHSKNFEKKCFQRIVGSVLVMVQKYKL